jgi:hypothetical protein
MNQREDFFSRQVLSSNYRKTNEGIFGQKETRGSQCTDFPLKESARGFCDQCETSRQSPSAIRTKGNSEKAFPKPAPPTMHRSLRKKARRKWTEAKIPS